MAHVMTRARGAAFAAVAALLITACAAVSPPGPDPSSSGFIKVPNTHDTHLFYWWFQSRAQPDTDPLVMARARCARWRSAAPRPRACAAAAAALRRTVRGRRRSFARCARRRQASTRTRDPPGP